MRNFIPINEGFTCESCGKKIPPAQSTFRNHCPFCLTSKHVDAHIPGDRKSPCKGLMLAVAYEGTDPDKLDLIHKCEKCGKTIRNKIAPDDDIKSILRITGG